jgi:predicted helicase
MRRAPGKQYGYVILPIGIPADMTPEQALADNDKYKVVWQVLQGLRAHDERFNALVNQIELNKSRPEQLQVIGVSSFGDEGAAKPTRQAVQGLLNFPQLGEWRDAIYAKIVKKVGDRRYWEDWAKDVSQIAERHTTRIKALLADPGLDVATIFDQFLAGLRANLNDGIGRNDAIDMLAQHLITKPVFDALFEGYAFTEHNPVSQVMEGMVAALQDQNLVQEQTNLAGFYESVRVRAEGIDNAEGKQQIITELYEKFFKIAFPRAAESLGIVYTPVEIVDFIIRSVEDILQKEFAASLGDAGVHVIDPFTGTGTFIARLLQSGFIQPGDLLRKYSSELHANEILLLAYYIAAINIEATYHGLAGGDYVPFSGIVLTDTFQIAEANDALDEQMFPQNNARVIAQNALDIRVIVANPPYSVGQTSMNDGNANTKYPSLDASISSTYGARSAGRSAASKTSLRDSYIRAIRWASNRIVGSPHGGIIGFVTNGAFIDSSSTDGLRKSLVGDFHSIYCFNLRGNTRTSGEQARREGGQTFGASSRSTVAITFLVKKPGDSTGARLYYRDIGDYLSRSQKLSTIAESTLATIPWTELVPSPHGDWINQRSAAFEELAALGVKSAKSTGAPNVVFKTYSRGVETSRDAWAYNYSDGRVQENIRRMIRVYNDQTVSYADHLAVTSRADTKEELDKFIELDPKLISWSGTLKIFLARGERAQFDSAKTTSAMYRPFSKQRLYFDRMLNHARGLNAQIFPTPSHENHGFVMTGVGAAMEFSVLAVNALPDLAFFGGQTNAQFFPRYTYERTSDDGQLFAGDDSVKDGWRRVDNIGDSILRDYRRAYGGSVSGDDVFFYVYAILHSPHYRSAFAGDLKKMLPRLPQVKTATDFATVTTAGRDLAQLHLGYETVERAPLAEELTGPPGPADYRVKKMAFGKAGGQADRSRIVYNHQLTLSGIPAAAYEYQLGSRSALEWIMERYQVKTDKASGIVNDPNDWATENEEPRYIVDLLKRIVTVSVKTMEIVNSLPSLGLEA